jgi:hypothetical protein
MDAIVEKSAEVTTQETHHGIGKLLRTVKTELQSRAMKHVSEGGAASSSLMSTHPAMYLWVEGIKEVSTIARGLFSHKEK